MISNLNSKINEFLNSEKIPKENFDDLKNVPENMEFSLLSKEFPELIDIIGYHGIVIEPLPVDEIVLKRIIERGKNFINWSSEKIEECSKVIASSEAIVGMYGVVVI